MESNLLVSADASKPRRIAIRPLWSSGNLGSSTKQTTSGGKGPASMVLVLEKLHGPGSSGSGYGSNTQHQQQVEQQPGAVAENINCTAKFLQTADFDAVNFRPLMREVVYGCLGLVHVENEPFICVVSDCSAIGRLEGSTIYRINNVIFFSLTTDRYDNMSADGSSFTQQRELTAYQQTPGAFDSYPEQYETLRHPCQHLQRLLSSGSFYFSYNFDLTRCAQVRHANSADAGSFWETADERYFWNRHIIKELLKFRRQLPEEDRQSLDQQGILVMATSGFIRIDEVTYSSDTLTLGILSRLSCKRAGTRFNTRGIDDDGNVANSVETEVLLYSREHCFSYLLLRGSVPVFWEQQGIQLGGHKIQITRSAGATQPAVERHFNDLVERYGKQCAVNLLSQKDGSAEQSLTEAFNQHVRLLNMGDTVRINNFDFHQAVKGNQFENLGLLMNELRDTAKLYAFFVRNLRTGEVMQQQTGTFRVNCLDCLDRTNVVQGLICKMVLNSFVQQTLKTTSENIFQLGLNDMWADNGDELSRIYTGTGALKSGFTRTGRRTLAGFMDDAKKSATRFYQNNFQDKYKQEVMDMLLGKLTNQYEIRLNNPVREAVMKELNSRLSEYASTSKMVVHVGTWNVNGKQPLGESIVPWLSFDEANPPHMFVIGFQEIVELSPQQIMATDNSKRQAWETLIVKTIHSFSRSVQYVPLRSGQLVGAALCVFVRSDLVGNIRNVDCTIKKTGMAGLAGNKGGVAIRMDVFDTNICFVCAHLAAGHSNVEDRNQDYVTISEGLTFNKGRKLSDHDNIIWLGDFNYRIDGDNEEIRSRAINNDLSTLLRYDQLSNQMRRGATFQGFAEGPIRFQPTYKYDNGTNQFDTSEKMRMPAWTDRILFMGPSIVQLRYERAELLSSDHKPVKALFEVELRIVNREARERIQVELYKKYSSSVTSQQQLNLSASSSNVKKSEGLLIDFGADDTPAPVTRTAQSTASSSAGWWDASASFTAAVPALPPRPKSSVWDDFSGMTLDAPSIASSQYVSATSLMVGDNAASSSSNRPSPSVPHKPQFLASSPNTTIVAPAVPRQQSQLSQNYPASTYGAAPALPARPFARSGSSKPRKDGKESLLDDDLTENPFADPL